MATAVRQKTLSSRTASCRRPACCAPGSWWPGSMADVSELAILNCNQGCHNGAAGGRSSQPVSGMAAPTSLRAGAKQLSMYSELLANALQDRGSQDEELRLEDLVDLARLQHQVLDLMHVGQGSPLNAFDGIASELEYD